MEKKRIGRPKKAEKNKQKKRVCLYLTEEKYIELKAQAKLENCEIISQYLYKKAFSTSRDSLSKEQLKMYNQIFSQLNNYAKFLDSRYKVLVPVSNNLNQLLKVIHTYREVDYQKLEQTSNDILEEISSIKESFSSIKLLFSRMIN